MSSVPQKFAAVAAAAFVATLVVTHPWSRASGPSTPAAAPEGTAASAPPPSASAPALAAAGVKPTVHVWKSPSCDCCSGWVERVRAAGYPVEVEEVADIDALKRARGIPTGLASCHTALIDGYLVEGHVPVEEVDRMLAERPAIAGLAVPGMPVGSPGMEMGDQHDHYQVVAFTKEGGTRVFAER